MPRERDLSFEKLAEVCGVDWQRLSPSARGALNASLAGIREAEPDLSDEELSMVIEGKARAYRKVFEQAPLTPTALAKHWPNLEGLLAQQQAPVTYVSHDREICTTCGGDRFVFSYYRRPILTTWIVEANRKKGRQPAAHLVDASRYVEERHGIEVWTPCPDCNQEAVQIVGSYLASFNRRYAGTRQEVPDSVQSFVHTNTEGTA